jgi:hypothetical protein
MQKFEDVTISTKTIVIDTNIDIHAEHIFAQLPVHPLPDCPPTSSKKKFRKFIADANLADGTIIALEYNHQCRGISIKHFRNSMTFVMTMSGKYINFKLPAKGRIQITGCKHDQYAEQCVQHLWKYLCSYTTAETPLYTFHPGHTRFRAVFHVVMSNRNFKLGFLVNRQKLDQWVNTQDEFPGTSLLELTFGYTGLNIKLPYRHQNIMLKSMQEPRDASSPWEHSFVEYNDYLKELPPKLYAKEIVKPRYNSFLVFRSGSAIMSGLDAHHMEKDYYRFMQMIEKSRDHIEDIIRLS